MTFLSGQEDDTAAIFSSRSQAKNLVKDDSKDKLHNSGVEAPGDKQSRMQPVVLDSEDDVLPDNKDNAKDFESHLKRRHGNKKKPGKKIVHDSFFSKMLIVDVDANGKVVVQSSDSNMPSDTDEVHGTDESQNVTKSNNKEIHKSIVEDSSNVNLVNVKEDQQMHAQNVTEKKGSESILIENKKQEVSTDLAFNDTVAEIKEGGSDTEDNKNVSQPGLKKNGEKYSAEETVQTNWHPLWTFGNWTEVLTIFE